MLYPMLNMLDSWWWNHSAGGQYLESMVTENRLSIGIKEALWAIKVSKDKKRPKNRLYKVNWQADQHSALENAGNKL